MTPGQGEGPVRFKMDRHVVFIFLAVSLFVVVPASTFRERHLSSRHSYSTKKIARSLHRPFNIRKFQQGRDNSRILGFNRAKLTANEQLKTRKRREDSGLTSEIDHRKKNFLETFSNQISSHIVDPVMDQLDRFHLEAQLKEIASGWDNPGSTNNVLPPETEVKNPVVKEGTLGTSGLDSQRVDDLPEAGMISTEEEVGELNPTFVLPQEEGSQLHVVEDPIWESNGFFSGDGSGSGDTGIMEEISGFVDTIFTLTEDRKDPTGDDVAQGIQGDATVDQNLSLEMNGLDEQLLAVNEQGVTEDAQNGSLPARDNLQGWDRGPSYDGDAVKTISDDDVDGGSGFENQLIDLVSDKKGKLETDEDEALENFLLPFSMEYTMISNLMDEVDQIKDAIMEEAYPSKENAQASQQSSSGDLSAEEKMQIASDELLLEDQRDEQNQLRDLTTCLSVTGDEILILPEDLCDGTKDCIDGEDENLARCERACSPGYSKCDDGLQCLKDNLFCNGIHQCHDRSDEAGCRRTMTDCEQYGMFSCDGVCRLKSFLCDHTPDCSDQIDELGCSYEVYSCPEGFSFDDVKLQCIYHV